MRAGALAATRLPLTSTLVSGTTRSAVGRPNLSHRLKRVSHDLIFAELIMGSPCGLKSSVKVVDDLGIELDSPMPDVDPCYRTIFTHC
jgi:hypothetical protein